MIKLFCGYEPREALGFHVFTHSVLRHASKPVSLTPLNSRGMPYGTNEFTYSRFLVPWLCGFQGHAIFADASDMLMLDDIAELDNLFDSRYAVQVVQRRDYETQNPVKYRGTSMECKNRNYPRKNWASLMIFNCKHIAWNGLNPVTIQRLANVGLLQLDFLVDTEIGRLPASWNVIVDEGDPVKGAQILHWTAGIPAFPEYARAPGAEHWFDAHREMVKLP